MGRGSLNAIVAAVIAIPIAIIIRSHRVLPLNNETLSQLSNLLKIWRVRKKA